MSRREMKPGIYMSPLPVALVSSGSCEDPNACAVAWTGVICSNPPRMYISLTKSRYSHEIISKTRDFVINMVSTDIIRATDTCGVKSGRDMNKFAECGLTVVPSLHVKSPSVAEAPMSIECRVFDVIELGSHDMFLADVVGITADESLFNDQDKLMYGRADLVAYSHGTYVELGKKVGDFGYSVEKKSTRRRKANNRK